MKQLDWLKTKIFYSKTKTDHDRSAKILKL